MAETKSERRPRRDANGRLATAGDLVGTARRGTLHQYGPYSNREFVSIIIDRGLDLDPTEGDPRCPR